MRLASFLIPLFLFTQQAFGQSGAVTAVPPPRHLKAWEERHGYDPIIRTLFGNDGEHETKIDPKYLPQKSNDTDEYYYKEFSNPVDNAVSAYLQSFLSGNDLLLTAASVLAAQNLALVTSNAQLFRLHSHALKYLTLKSIFVEGLSAEDAENELTAQLLKSLRSDVFGVASEMQNFSIDDRATWERQWKALSPREQYAFLSKAQELFYMQALRNAQKSYATILMYLAKNPDRDTWKSTVTRQLQSLFCQEPKKTSRFPSIDSTPRPRTPNRQRCKDVSELVVSSMREWIPLDEVMRWIGQGLNQTNGAIIQAQSDKGFDLVESDWEYQRYVTRYALTASGPGSAMLLGPLKEKIGSIRPAEVLSQNYGVWSSTKLALGIESTPKVLHPYLPTEDTTDRHELYVSFQKDTVASLQEAARLILKNFADLSEDYDQKSFDDIDFAMKAFEREIPSIGIPARTQDLSKLIRYQPIAVSQVWSKIPGYTHLIHDGTKTALEKIRSDRLRHKVITYTIMAIGIVLMVTGIGSLFGVGLISSASVASALFIAGTLTGLVDASYSYYYTSEKQLEYEHYERNLLSGNHGNLEDVRESYKEYLEARTARAWAMGGAILQVPQMIEAYRLIRGGMTVKDAFAAASGVMKDPPKLPQRPTEGLPTVRPSGRSISSPRYSADLIREYQAAWSAAQKQAYRSFVRGLEQASGLRVNEDDLLQWMYKTHITGTGATAHQPADFTKLRAVKEFEDYLIEQYRLSPAKARELTRSISDDPIRLMAEVPRNISGEESLAGVDIEQEVFDTNILVAIGFPNALDLSEAQVRALNNWRRGRRSQSAGQEIAELKKSNTPSLRKIGYILDRRRRFDANAAHYKAVWNEVLKFSGPEANTEDLLWFENEAFVGMTRNELYNVLTLVFSSEIRKGTDLWMLQLDLRLGLSSRIETATIERFKKALETGRFENYELKAVEMALRSISKSYAINASQTLAEMFSRGLMTFTVGPIQQRLFPSYSFEEIIHLYQTLGKPKILFENNRYRVDMTEMREFFSQATTLSNDAYVNGHFKPLVDYILAVAKETTTIDDLSARMLAKLESIFQVPEAIATISARERLLASATQNHPLTHFDQSVKRVWEASTSGWDASSRLIARELLNAWDPEIVQGLNLALGRGDTYLSQSYVIRAMKEIGAMEKDREVAKLAENLAFQLDRIKPPKTNTQPAQAVQAANAATQARWTVTSSARATSTLKKAPIEVQNVFVNEFLPVLRNGGLVDEAMRRRWLIEKYKGSDFMYAELDYVWRVHFRYNGRTRQIDILEFANHHP